MATGPVVSELSDPKEEDIEELLLICRYGELDELHQFVEKFGSGPLDLARDEDGNGVLHMACGNGHLGESLPLVEEPVMNHSQATQIL